MQAYIDAMEKRAGSDNEEEADIEKDVETQMAQITPTPSEEQRAKVRVPCPTVQRLSHDNECI